jgi:hypothetical protein
VSLAVEKLNGLNLLLSPDFKCHRIAGRAGHHHSQERGWLFRPSTIEAENDIARLQPGQVGGTTVCYTGNEVTMRPAKTVILRQFSRNRKVRTSQTHRSFTVLSSIKLEKKRSPSITPAIPTTAATAINSWTFLICTPQRKDTIDVDNFSSIYGATGL